MRYSIGTVWLYAVRNAATVLKEHPLVLLKPPTVYGVLTTRVFFLWDKINTSFNYRSINTPLHPTYYEQATAFLNTPSKVVVSFEIYKPGGIHVRPICPGKLRRTATKADSSFIRDVLANN